VFSFDETPSSSFLKSEVKKFRVLIFPHTGAYSIPQGVEADPTQVDVASAGNCSSFLAVKNSAQEWIPQGTVLSVANQFHFDLAQFKKTKQGPLYFTCSGAFVVQRAAPLKSFEYSGDFVVLPDQTQIDLINVLDAETYLKGVVPSEVENTWPVETLKAQAVAARTFAWWSVLDSRQSDSNFDLDDTVLYQAYLGNYQRIAATDAAVDQTNNILMKYNGQIIKAYFYADSGGYTEDASSVFGIDLPYCQAKPEQYDVLAAASLSDWQMQFTVAELSTLLAAANLIPATVSVIQINFGAGDLDRSGRVSTLHLLGSDNKKYEVSGPEFRYATKIRSTLFQISTTSSGFVFNGKGFGHGVGMAQVGALEYASQLQWTFDQILKFYYTGVTLTND